jgi:DNA mismatch repair protein MutL
MSSKIRVLDEQTINQIAAGEVIENPASVVKELVENSLDAGATDICVEIKTGGRQLIRITDNGCGMNKDDALLCLERHATSKIREVEDIHSIDTMGFRGEAVPSIASISKFTLMTSSSEKNEGTMIIVDGGKVCQCCPVVRDRGTTIEVKSLFFNVPVRKKFQRSPQYDANEVLKMLSSIAMGYPEIKIQLISDQKTVLSTALPPKESALREKLNLRLQDVLGMEFSTSSTYIEAEKNHFRIEGFVGTPSFTRQNRTGQYLFINRRAVFSPLVSFAVREGFGTALMSNRHPVFVLHLTIPGNLVDVNVHPQKKEVRLRHEAELKELIMEAVRNGMQHSPQEEAATFFDAPRVELPPAEKGDSFFQKAVEWSPPEISFPTSFVNISEEPTSPRPMMRMQKEEIASPQLLPTPPVQSIKVLATIKSYIIVDKEGLCLIDQKAAHSRIIFEELRQSQQSQVIQSLLIPYTFETSSSEAGALLNNLDSLNRMGLSIRQAGPNAFLVDALPQAFGNTDLQVFINEIVHAMNEFQDHAFFQKEQEKRIAVAASKASISQRHRLAIEEAQKLVDRLMRCQTPFQCPLGKPTMMQMSFEEIAKRFQKTFGG